MNLRISNQNRFQGAGEAANADPIRQARVTNAVNAGIQEATRFIGADSSVFARKLTTEEFIQKLEAAQKAIVAATNFDVAFQEQIRLDPLLASAFRSFIDLMMSG